MSPTRTTSHSRSAYPAPVDAGSGEGTGAGRLPDRFWKRTFLAAPVAVGLTLLTRLVGGSAVAIAPGFAPLQVPAIALLTAVALHGAAVVLALCFRFAARPVQSYQRIAAVVLLVSVVPDVAILLRHMPGATPATVGLLVFLHVAAGLVGVWLMPALAIRGGRAQKHATPEVPFSGLRDGASSFGTFYPTHYVLAVYPDGATADRAADALRAAGFASDDVIDVSGAAVLAYEDAADARKGVLTRLGQQWARLYTDATATSRRLRAAAARGAGFVLAYAPEGAQATRAASVLRPLGPNGLHYYGTFTVTKLS